MKKSYVIIFEIIITLCLLLTLFVKFLIKEKNYSLEQLFSMKPISTMIIAQKGNCNNMLNFLWTDVGANPYGDSATKETFSNKRFDLFKEENKPMPTKNIATIQTTSTDFLWSDVKVNPYGDSATRDTFAAKRTVLLKQENP